MDLRARDSVPTSCPVLWVLCLCVLFHLSPDSSGGLCCCLLLSTWRQTITLWDPSKSLGWILIDRCGKHFGTILNYLRDDTIILPPNRQEIKELMAEAKYYLIQGLVSMCQSALQVQKQSWGCWMRLGGWPPSGTSVQFLEGGVADKVNESRPS